MHDRRPLAHSHTLLPQPPTSPLGQIYAHVVTTGLDTVLVCYLEDLERNSENGRYVCSAEMHNMIAAHKERKTVN